MNSVYKFNEYDERDKPCVLPVNILLLLHRQRVDGPTKIIFHPPPIYLLQRSNAGYIFL